MFSLHKLLFSYARQLSQTDIDSIEIKDNAVVFITKRDKLKFYCTQPDLRTAPFEILNFHEYEPEVMRGLQEMLEKGHVFFDIGVNIGWYALSIAKRFPEVTVHAFEPIAPIYRELVKNVEENGLFNIHCHNFGFSTEDKIEPFYYDPNYSTRTSTVNLSEGPIQTIPGELKRLDDIVSKIGVNRLDLMKCDVEGAELFVFRGAEKTIRRYLPIIFSEMLRKWSAKFHYHPNDILDFLKVLGYRCFAIEPHSLSPCSRVDEKTVATNFLFLHEEKHHPQIKRVSAS